MFNVDYNRVVKHKPKEPLRIWGSIIRIKPAKSLVVNQNRFFCCRYPLTLSPLQYEFRLELDDVWLDVWISHSAPETQDLSIVNRFCPAAPGLGILPSNASDAYLNHESPLWEYAHRQTNHALWHASSTHHWETSTPNKYERKRKYQPDLCWYILLPNALEGCVENGIAHLSTRVKTFCAISRMEQEGLVPLHSSYLKAKALNL